MENLDMFLQRLFQETCGMDLNMIKCFTGAESTSVKGQFICKIYNIALKFQHKLVHISVRSEFYNSKSTFESLFCYVTLVCEVEGGGVFASVVLQDYFIYTSIFFGDLPLTQTSTKFIKTITCLPVKVCVISNLTLQEHLSEARLL